MLFDDSGRGHVSSAFAPLNSTVATTLSHVAALASPKPDIPLKLRTQGNHLALLQQGLKTATRSEV